MKKTVTTALWGTTLLLATTLCTTQALWAQAEKPGKDEVTFEEPYTNGPGCQFAEDSEIKLYSSTKDGAVDRMRLRLTEVVAKKPGKSRIWCTISLFLDHPKEWSYRLAQSTLYGYAVIPSGMTGQVTVESEFRGESLVKRIRKQKGPFDNAFTFRARFDHTGWSPCGKVLPLYIKIKAAIRGEAETDKEPFLMVDGTTQGLEDFQFEWRRCP